MEHRFELVPLPDPGLPDIKIQGSIAREENFLTVRYALSGKLDDVIIPERNPLAERKKELWLSTCFEFFLSFPDQPQYWEFNISPSGDWNAYRMDAYRQIRFREEELIRAPQLSFGREVKCYRLESRVDLSPILEVNLRILVGVAAVIESNNGHQTFWALTHPGPQADFHQRESFTLALEG